jgi:PAS domain S-box-containing protein
MLRVAMETRFDELKRYVRFTDDDASRLLGFRDTARPHFERIAQEFYERIREHEDAHSVFTGEEQIRRLQRSLVIWLERVLGGVYDESYFQRTWRIGQVHVKVGLPQRYMFTAMALVRSSLVAIADVKTAGDGGALRDAINRLLDLELAIMLDSYREDLTSRIERAAQVTQHRYVNAVELAEVIVIGLGEGGEIVFFNRHAEQMTGWARDEAIGRSFVELLMPEDARETYAPRFSTGIVEGEVDVPLRTRSGKIRDVLFRVARAPAGDDAVTAFAIGSDVTDEDARLALRHVVPC